MNQAKIAEKFGKRINHYKIWEIDTLVLTRRVVCCSDEYSYDEKKEIDFSDPSAEDVRAVKRWVNEQQG